MFKASRGPSPASAKAFLARLFVSQLPQRFRPSRQNRKSLSSYFGRPSETERARAAPAPANSSAAARPNKLVQPFRAPTRSRSWPEWPIAMPSGFERPISNALVGPSGLEWLIQGAPACPGGIERLARPWTFCRTRRPRSVFEGTTNQAEFKYRRLPHNRIKGGLEICKCAHT